MAPGPLPRCGSGSCRQKLVRAFKRAAARTRDERDRKSTRLNSSHLVISYAVFCLKKKKKKNTILKNKTKQIKHQKKKCNTQKIRKYKEQTHNTDTYVQQEQYI